MALTDAGYPRTKFSSGGCNTHNSQESDLQTIAEELSRSNILEIWNDKHLLYLCVLADLIVEDGDP